MVARLHNVSSYRGACLLLDHPLARPPEQYGVDKGPIGPYASVASATYTTGVHNLLSPHSPMGYEIRRKPFPIDAVVNRFN